MSDISKWSNSAGGNTASPPDGWPENQAPSTVNNCAREMMASLRRQHEQAEWVNWGHTPTFATTANFTVAGDHSTVYHAGRRIKANDSSIIYGTISSVTFSTNTRVSVTWDSGQMTNSLSGVEVGILSFENQSIPATSATAAYARSAGFATTAGYAVSAGFAKSASSANYLTFATENSTANSSNLNISGIGTTIVALNFGQVNAGSRILVNVSANYRIYSSTSGITPTYILTDCFRNAGTFYKNFANLRQINYFPRQDTYIYHQLSGILKITATVSLTISLRGYGQYPSINTGLISANKGQIYCTLLKN